MDSSNSEILTHFHNTFLKLIFLQFQEVDSELFLTSDEQAGVGGSAVDYEADEQAGVSRLSWRISGR